jgi:hypothetical protein
MTRTRSRMRPFGPSARLHKVIDINEISLNLRSFIGHGMDWILADYQPSPDRVCRLSGCETRQRAANIW